MNIKHPKKIYEIANLQYETRIEIKDWELTRCLKKGGGEE